jgi:hypothetical protein
VGLPIMNLPAHIASALAVAGVAAVVGEPNTPPVDTSAAATLLGLIERFGVMAVLLVYFVVRDYLRYRADQTEKREYKASIAGLQSLINGDHKALIAKQGKELNRARQTHDVLIETLENYEPTEIAVKALETARKHDSGGSETKIQAVKQH